METINNNTIYQEIDKLMIQDLGLKRLSGGDVLVDGKNGIATEYRAKDGTKITITLNN